MTSQRSTAARSLLGAIAAALPRPRGPGWLVTSDIALLRRFYVLFFLHVPIRQVFFAEVTSNPTGTEKARKR
ncbi:MAG: hypothetical protein GY925_22200 [Actinomycetia bacterium]|nr:hypothetical protein [Actinomycetes bacterium]